MSLWRAGVLIAVLGLLATLIWWSLHAPAADRDDVAPGLPDRRPVSEPPAQPHSGPAREEAPREAAGLGVAALSVRVRWSDGSPAAGIRALVRNYPDQDASHREATTDAAGSFRVADLTPGVTSLWLDRWGTRERLTLAPGEDKQLDLQVPAGVNVRGRVVAPQGVPVPDAHVRLAGAPLINVDVARCDGEGRFTLRDVEPGRSVGAWARGFAPSPLVEIDGKPGRDVAVELRFPGQGGTLQGRVLERATRQPIRGAAVLEVWRIGASTTGPGGQEVRAPPPRRALTDGEGRFHLEGLPAGNFSFTVAARDHAPWAGHVRISAGKTERFSVELARTVRVYGRITTQSGEPLPDVRISAAGASRRSAKSDRDGSYDLHGLRAGRLRLRARSRVHGDASYEIDAAPGEAVEWNAVLDPGEVLHGRLVAVDGKPVVGWWISLGDNKIVRTNKRGSFRFIRLERKAYTIHVRDAMQQGGFVLASFPDQWPQPQERILRLTERARADAFLTGTILDPLGRPHARFSVIVAQLLPGEAPVRWFARTRRSGRFKCGPMPPGRYRLLLKQPRRPDLPLGEYTIEAAQELDIGELRR